MTDTRGEQLSSHRGEERFSLAVDNTQVRAQFASTHAETYVDTANYGLPPMRTVEALSRALDDWQCGRASALVDWDPIADQCRELAARILGVPAGEIALMPAVSVAVGLIAASLQPGDEVVVADDEFRSVLFPLLASAQSRATTIRRVPFASIADAVSPSTKLVATSFVRSNGGSVQNMVAVSSAARANGARVLVDATHGAGVLPFDAQGLGLDYVVAAAYKHLLCPRGVAFLRIAEDAWDQVSPLLSSWRSAAEPYTSFYGGTLADLAADASRFDVSLAWHPWVGARESLDFIARIDPEERRSWCVGLADALAAALGLEPSGSSILAVPVRCQLPEVKRCLEEASIVASYPAGIVRFSFHAYNTLDDVGRVAEVLGPLRG